MKFKFAAIAGFVVLLLTLTAALLQKGEISESDSSETLHHEDTYSPSKGDPDRFFKYHRDIRTPIDGTEEYSAGYQIREFQKALAMAKTPGIKLDWSERGPGNVGGRTRALLVDPEDPNMHTWYAGSVSGGLWKTTDGGENWVSLTDHLPNLSVSALTMAESNPNIIYMGTGESMAGAGSVAGYGIFKSSDKGEIWTQLASTADRDQFRYVNRLAVDPSNPDVVLAATNYGIFRSTDGGSSWEQTSQEGVVQDLRAQPGNFNRQIASARQSGEILVSDDAGQTWEFAWINHVDEMRRTELAYSPSHPNIAYASVDGAVEAQLYRSDDGGLNWWPTSETTDWSGWMGGQGWFNNSIAVHPYDPNIVFVGGIVLYRLVLSGEKITGDPLPGRLNHGGTDSWLEFRNIDGEAFDGRAYSGRFRSLDTEEEDFTNIEIRFGQGSQKAHRFWVSKTAGRYGNGGPEVPFFRYMFADYVDVPFQVWDVDNNRQLMVSFRDQAEDGKFNLIEYYRSENLETRDLQSYEFIFVHKYDYSDAAPDSRIAQNGGVDKGMVYGLLPVLASGAAWTPDNLPNQTVTLEFIYNSYSYVRSLDEEIDPGRTVHVDHHGIYPLPINEAENKFWILNVNDGGVAISKDNGKTFRETDRAHSGYNTSQVYGVAKAPGTSDYVTGLQDNGSWRSGTAPTSGSGWRSVYSGDGIETIWHPGDRRKILVTAQRDLVARTTDGGGRWERTSPFDAINGIFLTSIDNSDRAPDDVYLVKAEGVMVSRDFGLTWNLTSIEDSWNSWDGCKVRVSLSRSNVVWAGCGLYPYRMLHVSRDRGRSFNQAALPTMDNAPRGDISGLATHPLEDGTAYALFSLPYKPKILETKDYGQTWTDLSGFSPSETSTNGFPNVAVYDLIIMPHAPHVFWAGTEIGLFVSDDHGAQWNYADNGLPAASVWRMKIRDDELIVGTHGRGVWTLPLSEIDIHTSTEESVSELPSEFSLSQNYPNPFNASTNIEFSISHDSHVRLAVFDVTGRKVSDLTDRVYAPGVHRLQWNANAYSSGIYIYRMELDGRIVHTRRMTLQK